MPSSKRKNTAELAYDNLTKSEALVVALEAAARLKWSITYLSATGLILHTDNGMFQWNGELTIKLDDEAIINKSQSADNRLFDGGRNKEAIQQFVTAFEDQKQSLTAEAMAEKYAELENAFPPATEDILQKPPLTTGEKIAEFFSLFKPAEGYAITPIILDLNILIFILMVVTGTNILAPDNESILNWGANFRPLTLGGQWWRLLTNCFVHIGIFHLLMNSYALVLIGAQLEPLLGRSRFLAAYICTGVIASITSLWWHDLTISAGASGAIFGLYGVFLAMLTTNLIEKTARKRLLSSILIFVAYNLMYGMKGGIDNAAHVGGLLSGLVVGYAYFPGLREGGSPRLKLASIGIIGALVLCLSVWALRSIPNDIGTYDKKMATFSANEDAALSVLKLPKGTPDEQVKAELERTGIPKWKENLQILKEVDALNMPDIIKERDKLLTNYTELRLQTYELTYKAITKNTNQYEAQLEACYGQIDSVLKILNK